MDDAPTWLIYEDAAGVVTWRRLANGIEPYEVLDAELMAGGHTAPADVLAWLNGATDDPFTSGNGWGDAGVLERLAEKIRL